MHRNSLCSHSGVPPCFTAGSSAGSCDRGLCLAGFRLPGINPLGVHIQYSYEVRTLPYQDCSGLAHASYTAEHWQNQIKKCRLLLCLMALISCTSLRFEPPARLAHTTRKSRLTDSFCLGHKCLDTWQMLRLHGMASSSGDSSE